MEIYFLIFAAMPMRICRPYPHSLEDFPRKALQPKRRPVNISGSNALPGSLANSSSHRCIGTSISKAVTSTKKTRPGMHSRMPDREK